MASTPFPPDNREFELASLRLHETEQLDPQRLDGSAEGPQEATPVTPSDGLNGHALSTSVRLSDAEHVAAERLDGAAEGSLQEALAIAPADDSPRAAASLVDRIELVGNGLAAEPATPPLDVKPAEAGHPASEAAPAPEPLPAALAEGSGAIDAVESVAAPGPAVGEGADGGLSAEPAATSFAPAGGRPPIVAVVQTDARAPESGRPLASALDAAAKLAADANAAAAALENLKRLLERQLPNVAAGNAPRSVEAAARQMSAHAPAAPMPPQPPTLPLHAVRDGSGRSTLRHAVLAPPPPPRRAAERLRLDVRGFLAGFALSWAFGVVLYLLMTAG